MKCLKHCFTLIELLIVLVILALGMGLTGVKIAQIYQEQRFNSEGEKILSHLMMAQDLMLILDADVKVKIEPDSRSNQLLVWMEVEKPFKNQAWEKLIERKIRLNSIRSFDFDDHHGKELVLRFAFGKMSKGTLTLYEEDALSNGRKLSIHLSGIPGPLKRSAPEKKEDAALYSAEKSTAIYPQEVHKALYEDNKTK